MSCYHCGGDETCTCAIESLLEELIELVKIYMRFKGVPVEKEGGE